MNDVLKTTWTKAVLTEFKKISQHSCWGNEKGPDMLCPPGFRNGKVANTSQNHYRLIHPFRLLDCITLKFQSRQLWLSSMQTVMLTGHRNSHEFNLYTKPYPVKVGHTLRRKCNVWEKSWQKPVDSLPSEYITLPVIFRNIPMTSHNFHIRLKETTTLAKNMIQVTPFDIRFTLDQTILKTKLLGNDWNSN